MATAANPPDPKWPGGARIAVNINLNVEAGRRALPARRRRALRGCAQRHRPARPITAYAARSSKSIFEYGPRSGCWRLLRIFKRFDVKISILGVVRALEQCPELTRGLRRRRPRDRQPWLPLARLSRDRRGDRARAYSAGRREHQEASPAQAPVGWFNGRPSNNTRRLLVEHGGFLYDRDYLGDELPFWIKFGGRDHLVIPTSFETNDNRFDRNPGFRTADGFARYMMDCFDLLYEEGAEQPEDDGDQSA